MWGAMRCQLLLHESYCFLHSIKTYARQWFWRASTTRTAISQRRCVYCMQLLVDHAKGVGMKLCMHTRTRRHTGKQAADVRLLCMYAIAEHGERVCHRRHETIAQSIGQHAPATFAL